MILSICIPTYNRSNMLLDLLDSIYMQLDDELFECVEVTISDNHSNDDTEEMIQEYKKTHKKFRLIYHKNETNIGADRNYLKCVELATGKYAWIIGSDDIVREGAISRALNQILEGHSLYCSNRIDYNIDMTQELGFEYIFKQEIGEEKVFCINSSNDLIAYFDASKNLGGVCSYLSSFFFDRDMFLSSDGFEEYFGTAYIHVYMIFQGLLNREKASIKVISEPFINCRFGNDSFFVNTYQRIMLDFYGYLKCANVFKDPLVKRAFLDILKRDHSTFPWNMLLKMSKKQQVEFVNVLNETGYSEKEIDLWSRLSRHKLSLGFLYADEVFHTSLSRLGVKND